MSDSTVGTIERYIFEAWSADLTGADVIDYVCARTDFEPVAVENVLNALIDRMYD
jgi:hypothetical protein